MSEQFENIDPLIVRSLENSLSAEEKTTLQQWLDEDATHRRYFDEIRRTWTLTGDNTINFIPDTEANWHRFKQRISGSDASTTLTPIRSRRSYWGIAAAIAGIAATALLYFSLSGPHEIIEQTAAMEKKTVILPDGSKVYMNQNSKLRYSKQLAGAERAIYLEGEAFFEVAPKQARPFVVYAQHTQTLVLGTSFDVKAYDPNAVEVAVVTGKVAVSHKEENNRLVVLPGRKAMFGEGQQPEEYAIVHPDYINWKEHSLKFDGVEMSEVVKTLEEYYGVKIEIKDKSIDTLHIDNTYDIAPDLKEVLDVITATTNASWRKEGGVYRIEKK